MCVDECRLYSCAVIICSDNKPKAVFCSCASVVGFELREPAVLTLKSGIRGKNILRNVCS